MPKSIPKTLRGKAVFAPLHLTGIRVGVLMSLRIRHIDPLEKSVSQSLSEVKIKFGKPIGILFAKGFDEAEVVFLL